MQRHPLLVALLVIITLAGLGHLIEHVSHCGDQSGNCHLCQIATALFPAVVIAMPGLLASTSIRLQPRETVCSYGFDPRTLASRAPPHS